MDVLSRKDGISVQQFIERGSLGELALKDVLAELLRGSGLHALVPTGIVSLLDTSPQNE